MNATMKKQNQFDALDAFANRVYQAFERLQMARYSVNGQLDETAITELQDAEEEWLEARASVCADC